jgi:hypothetical protein
VPSGGRDMNVQTGGTYSNHSGSRSDNAKTRGFTRRQTNRLGENVLVQRATVKCGRDVAHIPWPTLCSVIHLCGGTMDSVSSAQKIELFNSFRI